mmetsp:Transcript_23757/g.54881  ORF Transcript_23757/g.54881 Transcript_23757/m.54881 type:complete len:189 (-) Transcript_23757:179-745(-)
MAVLGEFRRRRRSRQIEIAVAQDPYDPCKPEYILPTTQEEYQQMFLQLWEQQASQLEKAIRVRESEEGRSAALRHYHKCAKILRRATGHPEPQTSWAGWLAVRLAKFAQQFLRFAVCRRRSVANLAHLEQGDSKRAVEVSPKGSTCEDSWHVEQCHTSKLQQKAAKPRQSVENATCLAGFQHFRRCLS